MSTLAQLVVKVGADVSGVSKGLNQVETKLQGLGEKMKTVGSKLQDTGKTMTAAITLPIVGAAVASFKLASDMNESLNKVDVAFKDSSQQVKDWSENTLTQFGLAKGTALDMAAGYGDMATSMGLSTEQAAQMSTSLVGLAGDLASFKNIGIDQANDALTAIFTGETESLKRLGVVMTQANLDEYAAAQGINKKVSAMTQAEQVQLRYNYVMARTQNAQGDFARTQSGAANQMRIFGESLKELGASFGANLLPVITPIINKLNLMIKTFGGLSPATQKTIIVMAGVAAALGPVLIGLGSLAGAIISIGKAAGMLAKGFSAISNVSRLGSALTFLLSPAGLVVAAILAIAAVGYYLYKHWDTIGPKLAAVWQGIKNKAAAIWNGIKEFFARWWPTLLVIFTGPLGALVVLIVKHWEQIKQFTSQKWTALKTWLTDFITGLSTSIGAKFSAVSGAVSRTWDAVKSYTIDIWNEIKDSISGVIQSIVSNISGMFDQLEQLRLKAKGALTGVTYTFNGSGSTATWGNQAQGTDFWKGGLTWVGEQGPELLNLPRGAQVMNNRQSMAMVNGKQTINHTGTIIHQFQTSDGQVVKRIAEQFERDNRRIPTRVTTMPSMA